jgi:hypothetical protein
MVVPDVPGDGDAILWASGPIGITETMDGGVCILSSVMHAVGQGASKIMKDTFCSSIVTEFR